MGEVYTGSTHLKAGATLKASGEDRVPYDLSVSPETDKLIGQIAEALGVSKVAALALGMKLLGLAVAHEEEGRHLAVLNPDKSIAEEIPVLTGPGHAR
jgi:hypothetical protein